MALSREQRNEYQRRSCYRRFPLADEWWKRLKPLAVEFGGRMSRASFVSALVRDYIASPHPLQLTDSGKTWTHSQRGVVPPHLNKDLVAEAMLIMRLRESMARGDGVLAMGRAASGEKRETKVVELE